MSYTWTQFQSAVSAIYHTGAQSAAREASAIEAVAHYVKAGIVREVEGDLSISKSFRDAYVAAKVKLAGYTITSNFATVKTAVQALITVDAARTGIAASGGYIDKYIQQGIDDINGAAILFDQYVLSAAIEAQRHVPCYQSNQRTAYKKGDSGVVIDGFVTKITLPDQSRFRQLLFGTYYTDLAANTAYNVDDYVQSNGRVYVCVGAGTSANPLGDGLISTDGEEEASGTADFTYYSPLDFFPANPIAWGLRHTIQQNQSCERPLFALAPTGTELWLYPALDDDHAALLEWDGLKTSFSGADATPFDQPAAQFAAEWVRGMIQKNVGEDSRAAATSFSVAQGLLKRLWMDCNART